MADDRMYLIHRPTGVGVSMGKRFGREWTDRTEENQTQELFDHVKDEFGDPNDFIIVCESHGDEWSFCGRISKTLYQFKKT